MNEKREVAHYAGFVLIGGIIGHLLNGIILGMVAIVFVSIVGWALIKKV